MFFNLEQIQLKSNQVTDLSEKLQQKHVSLINVKKQLEVAHSEKMILRRNLETCTQERDNFRILQTVSEQFGWYLLETRYSN